VIDTIGILIEEEVERIEIIPLVTGPNSPTGFTDTDTAEIVALEDTFPVEVAVAEVTMRTSRVFRLNTP
jgi:hypothetical protein